MQRIGWVLASMLLIGCAAGEASDNSPDSPITTTASEESSAPFPESSAMTTTTITEAVDADSDSTVANNGSSPSDSNATTAVIASIAPSTAPATIATTTIAVPTTVPPPVDPVGLRVEAEYTSGYNRDLFRHWIDADGDGCDTRKEVLIAESLEPVQTGSQCAILTGRWYSIYDNTETTDSSRFDIDHVVADRKSVV